MTNQYEYGREKGELVTRRLREKGAKVKLSQGSHGAADLIAEFPSGKKWHVQVKATRKGKPASPSPKDAGRLKSSASKNKATAVIAKVSRNEVSYSSARIKRRLKP